MRLTTLTMFATVLLALSLPASADVSLADWCVNLNGDTNTACNGAGNGGGAISLTNFDTTTEPGLNKLGKIVVTVGTGSQLIAAYMDYDVDFTSFGSFQDSGSTSGTASGTQSYELDDPNTSNIFLISQALVPFRIPTMSELSRAPPTPCCDVAWALEESLFVDPALYSGATVTFYVNATKVAGDSTSGFFLQQTNGNTNDTIFLSDTISLTPLGGGPVTTPEPSSVILFVTLIVGALFLRKRSSASAV